MKKLLLSFAFLTIVALAFAQESAMSPKDLSGFSGYGWGTSYGFVRQDMENENYELVASGPTDLWYRGFIFGGEVQIVYIFSEKLLISGMWILDDVDYGSFWQVHEFLQNAYNNNHELEDEIRIIASMKDGDGWIESEIWPRETNAKIVHNLDIEDDLHEVHYYYRRGEE
jgi:hypothetical protein